jgi:glycosyltransferase involved in cell wall biosynthesis
MDEKRLHAKLRQLLTCANSSHPMSDPNWPAVSLCIPTFRRPEGLRKLLSHVAALTYPGPLSVVVVDNDGDQRAGDAVVRDIQPQFPFPLSGVVEPRPGQTYAYNTGFATAARRPATDYVAVLDDDEFPAPNWLTEMIATAVRCQADIVGGPVFPVFDDPEHWLAKSDLYAPYRYATGPVDMIYGAGSMVIRRDVLDQYLDEPFSHAFAFTGGSDLDFFVRCRRDGRSFAWADEAHVFETTPRSRTTTRWLLLRYFRKGSEAGRLDRLYPSGHGAALRRWVSGAGLVGYGAAAAVLTAWRGRAAIMGKLLLVARGMGRLAAEFDILYEGYRPPGAATEAVVPTNSTKAPRE